MIFSLMYRNSDKALFAMLSNHSSPLDWRRNWMTAFCHKRQSIIYHLYMMLHNLTVHKGTHIVQQLTKTPLASPISNTITKQICAYINTCVIKPMTLELDRSMTGTTCTRCFERSNRTWKSVSSKCTGKNGSHRNDLASSPTC